MTTWPAIESLIPHRAPMLLVERIVEVFEGGSICLGSIRADSPFAHQGAASAFFGLELAAQTAAVHEALRRDRTGGAPRIGYLASVRTARFRVRHLPAGEPLRATVRTAGGVSPLALYNVEVALEEDGSELLEATLATYLLPEAGGADGDRAGE